MPETFDFPIKLCCACKEEKPLSSFRNNKSRKDGLNSSCRDCDKARDKAKYEKFKQKILQKSKERYVLNKERHSALGKQNYEKNKEAYLERARRQRELYPEEIKEYKKQWMQKNKHIKAASNSRRRSSKIMATPSWLTQEDKLYIESLFAVSRWLSNTCFNQYHVDHIVPLKGKGVCGLHVPWNLRVISAKENLSKSNKMED